MAKITKTIEVDGFGDGFSAYAYTGKRGAHKDAPRVGMRITVADLVGSPELLKLVSDQVVSFAFTPEQAEIVGKRVRDARPALKAAGVKVPATRKPRA